MVSARTTIIGLFGSLNLLVESPLQHRTAQRPTMGNRKGWLVPPGSYTAKELIYAYAPLLETILHHLGPSPVGEPAARDVLLDNLALNLALGNSASTISIPVKNPSSAELAKQADDIGKTLVEYARAITGVQYDPNLSIRSPCEGHVWKQPTTQLLFGPRSLEHLAQLFNEYVHQVVLLRDSLLPFKNYKEVVIPIEATEDKKRGMRWAQQARASFLAEIMSKSISQDAMFKFAKALLAPSLVAEHSYGFQYEQGLIIPSFVVGDDSFRLFQYIPAIMDSTTPCVAFNYQVEDYYTAHRTEIGPADETIAAGDVIPESLPAQDVDERTEIAHVPLAKGLCTASRQLQLSITRRNTTVDIDLGQISRGRRYSYPLGKTQGAPTAITSETPIHLHSAWKILTEAGPGLVTAKEGIHLIKAASNIELLALLGKIYPESVTVMKEGESLEAALKSGKGLSKSGRFIIQTKGDIEVIMPRR